ncbi:MAG: TolC family protein [Candidatus Omnitrophota bacterium]
MRKITIFFMAIFIYALNLITIFGQEKGDLNISLEQFIKAACEKDMVFKEILIDQLKLKYQKLLKLPAGDIVLAIESQHDFLFDPDESDTKGTISLSKLFPYTGTEVTTEYTSSLSTSTRAVTSEFTAYISQPIAENAFGKNTRLLDKITGLEVDAAQYQIIEAYEDYLASLIQLYYNWYSAYENLKAGQVSYAENTKLLENIKERQKNKIALAIDVNKINLQVVAKKENLVSLEQEYAEYLNLIKQAISYKEKEDILPQDSLFYAEAVIDFAQDYKKFFSQSRTSLMLKLLEEKSSLEVSKYADELLPSIDFIAGYTVEGLGRDLHKPEKIIYAGLSLDWPFSGRVENAQYEISKIDLKKTKLSSENIHTKLYTNLKNLNNQIEQEKKLISIAKDKTKLSEAIVEDETKDYSLGRTTLNSLIDEINKLENNKFSQISHQIQSKKLIVEWLRLTDILVKSSDIVKKQ